MKTIIIYNNMLFASPGHLMNHFRVNNIVNDIDTKLLTQYAFKGIERIEVESNQRSKAYN
jgi:hypothetical protein